MGGPESHGPLGLPYNEAVEVAASIPPLFNTFLVPCVSQLIGIMRHILALLLMLSVVPYTGMAQDHPYLERFQAVEVEGRVFLSWTLRAGNTCNGVQIQRSVGSLSFVQIGEIPGVCGSINDDVDYTFFDSLPVPQSLNNYRLELGSEGVSQIISIQLSGIPPNGYQIRPHPVIDRSELLFKNERRQNHLLQLFDMNGKTVLETSNQDQKFILHRHELSAGVYLFRLRDADGVISTTGKIVVAP